MDRDAFLHNLNYASDSCREFTAQYVLDALPAASAFWVMLNSSHDQNLKDGEVVFPDDVETHGKCAGPLTADGVVSLLWRDGMIPEWIDIRVWEADQDTTNFELTCCGRFTADPERLYYNWADFPPFGVKGPPFPPRLALSAVRGEPVEKFTLAESRQQAIVGRGTSE